MSDLRIIATTDTMVAFEQFLAEQNAQMARWLLGIDPIPEPAPKREYWQTQGHGMVCIIANMVYHLTDGYEPEKEPFARREDVQLIRRCTGFDF